MRRGRIARSDGADDLLIDTGSSYTWLGSDQPYAQTSDAQDQNRTFSIRYGSGQAEGEHWKANCQFQGVSGSRMNNQGFGVASSSSGFGNVDGILGIGPTPLSSGTVQGLGQIPTVIDTLKRQNRIPNAVVAASFTPNTKGTAENRGSLALGGVDSSKFKVGSLVYTNKINSNPYWGAKINKFTYATSTGTKTLATNPTGIVDTGACTRARLRLTSQAPRSFSCPPLPTRPTWPRFRGITLQATLDSAWYRARPTPAWATSRSSGTTSRFVDVNRELADRPVRAHP